MQRNFHSSFLSAHIRTVTTHEDSSRITILSKSEPVMSVQATLNLIVVVLTSRRERRILVFGLLWSLDPFLMLPASETCATCWSYPPQTQTQTIKV